MAVYLHCDNLENLCNELKCSKCERLLNVSPIYYGPEIGNVCGRCKAAVELNIANGSVQRAVTYETVAKYLKFPCSFKNNGCNVFLMWDEVVEHEANCPGRSLNCFIVNCKWLGNKNALVPHCRDYHDKNYCTLPINFSLTSSDHSYRNVFLTTISPHTFVIDVALTGSTFSCSVKCVFVLNELENNFYRFQLEIGKEKNSSTLIFRKEKLNSFWFNDNNGINIDINSVVNILDCLPNDLLEFKISLLKKFKKDIKALESEFNIVMPSADSDDAKPNVNILASSTMSVEPSINPAIVSNQHNECICCKNSVSPLTFICRNNHYVCKSCKPFFNMCLCCMPLLPLPSNCDMLKNNTNEPNTKGNTEGLDAKNQLNIQKLKCPFRLIKDICDHKDELDIVEHFQQCHYLHIFKQHHVFAIPLINSNPYYAILYASDIFILRFQGGNIKSLCKFECFRVGVHNNKSQFVFEVEFIDQKSNGFVLIVSQLCRQPESIQSINSLKKNALAIPCELLAPFIGNEPHVLLYFKCRIRNV